MTSTSPYLNRPLRERHIANMDEGISDLEHALAHLKQAREASSDVSQKSSLEFAHMNAEFGILAISRAMEGK